MARINTVSECCPHCCNEATIKWNVEEDGHKAYCPVCGKVLMLCSQCDYENGCDWDNENNTCKHNLKDELSEIGK